MKLSRLIEVLGGGLMLGLALCTGIPLFSQSPIDAVIDGLNSTDVDTRSEALYALMRLSGQQNGFSSATIAVLSANPQQAERIKTALISALEKQGAEYERLIKNGQQMTEEFENSWISLSDTVAALQDPRAARGLLLAMMNGAGVEGLADICPSIVDSIIQRAHEPVIYWRGAPLRLRGQAANVLGECLRRPMASFSPESASKIRRELMSALDDPDPDTRALAASALMPLRAEPDIQAKLRILAETDPYVSPENDTREGSAKFVVRDAAARALQPPDANLFYVTRTTESRACRVERVSEQQAGQLFIGPYNSRTAHENMCRHYDSTGHNPSFCWLVEPPNACSQQPAR